MDPKTVIGTLAMHLVCTGALLHLIGRHMPRGSGVHDWGTGALVFGLAYFGRLALGLGGGSPWTLPLDGLMFAASLLFVGGLRSFTGRGSVSGRMLLLAFAGFLLLQATLAATLGAQGRHVSLNLALGCSYSAMGLTALQALRRSPEGLTAPLIVLGVLMGALGLLTLGRSATILAFGTAYLYGGTFAQVYFSYAAIAAALMALVLVWMVFLRFNRRLAELAVRDPLTGLLNRSGLNDVLQRHFARRNAEPLHVLQMDVDHFKHINDRHGHAAGDAVLAAVAGALNGLVRGSDLVARTGGEEFVVVGVGGDPGTAQALGERLRLAVSALEVDVAAPLGTQRIRCTMSVGISACVRRQDEWTQAWREADKALYSAKAKGRDRVEMFVPGMTLPGAA